MIPPPCPDCGEPAYGCLGTSMIMGTKILVKSFICRRCDKKFSIRIGETPTA